MLGRQSDQRGLWEADSLYIDHVGRRSFYSLLASIRGKLFRDEDFAEPYCADNGRDSVPPSLLATALLLPKSRQERRSWPDEICICEGGVLARPGCVEARGTLQVREDASYFWAPPPHRPLPAGPVSGTWSCCPIWTPSVLYPKYAGKSGRRWPGFGRRSWSRQKVWGPRW